MQYVCDAGTFTWFRLETLGEAALESRDMEHAVERYFKEAHDEAVRSYVPPKSVRVIEQSIGRKDYVARVMPRFVTLRDNEGTALVTAMLPPDGKSERDLRPIIVGKNNADPYSMFGEAIGALARHLGMRLERQDCYPYARRR